MNWEKMSNDQKYAAQYALAILENGQMPSLELLKAAGLSKADAQKLMAQIQPATTGTTGTPKTYYSDKEGYYYEVDSKGNMKPVDEKKVSKNSIIDKTYENMQGNVYPYVMKGYEDEAKKLLQLKALGWAQKATGK